MTDTTTPAKRARVLAVASGKGGVGKTSLTINVSVALARLGHRVAVVDADFGLGNVDVMLGLTPEWHVGHLMSGEKPLGEVLIEGPGGLSVLPAGSGVQPLTAPLSRNQRERLDAVLERVRDAFDFLVIDTAAGISTNVIETLRLAEQVLLVTSLDPAALVDAYALAKVVWQSDATAEIGLVVNGVRDELDGQLAFRQIDLAAARFLGQRLRYLGCILDDPGVREAVRNQRPIVDYLPHAPASRCFRSLAARLAALRVDPGGLQLVAAGTNSLIPGEPQWV
ncbi:MAG: MinD/ParA family protein [Acidobacteriota bacterium]